MGVGGELAPPACRPAAVSARADPEVVDREIGDGNGGRPKKGIDGLVDAIEAEIESVFKVALLRQR